jgi:hypothetical protein
VVAGQTYTVGEEGMETLVMSPGGGGYVIPGASHGGGGSSANVTVRIPVVLDGRVIAEVVDQHFQRTLASAARTTRAV